MQIEKDLSICTVVDGQFKSVERMISSIISTADPVAVEIIVANTDGQPLTADGFVEQFPDVVFFDLPGVTAVQAKNHAMRFAKGRYVGLFDFDIVVTDGCLKTLVDFMDDHPDTGAAGPQIINAYGKIERTARAFHTLLSVLGQSAFGWMVPGFFWKPRYFVENWNHRSISEVDWLCGGAHLLRKELIEDIGMLNEHMPYFFEEEYYLRSQKSGWHNFYVHNAQAIHPNPGRYGVETTDLKIKDFSAIESARFFHRKWLR